MISRPGARSPVGSPGGRHRPAAPRLVALVLPVVLALALAATATACGGATGADQAGAPGGTDPATGDPGGSGGSAGSGGTAGPTGTPAPPDTDPVSDSLGSGNTVTFAFGGDVHFEQELRALLDRDAADVLAPQRSVLSSADIAMVNLETAITTRGTAVPKDFTFRAPPAAFTALAGAGVDVATVANNHGMDYGSLAREVGKKNVTANCIAPGFIRRT